MNNYQLTKTNVLLGGQMEWNLQISGKNDNLYINDFFLSPISKWIGYNRPDRDSLNYTHSENIKDLFNNIRSSFFEPKIDPRLNSTLPIITEDPSIVDTYCDMYDSGISRTSKSRHGKTIQVLCPLWLEDFNQDDIIEFNLEFYTNQDVVNEDNTIEKHKDIIITKKLRLSHSSIVEYHDRFVKYFQDYIKSISEKQNIIGDKLLNIDLKHNYMSIEGIDLQTGTKINKDVSYNLPNITSRFRPMMDTDSLLINLFSNSNMVCKQLFNFNLIFDFEDLLSHKILKDLMGTELLFDITTNIIRENNTNRLDIKSFSYNYEKDFDIKQTDASSTSLEFFEDYNFLGLIDKNKIYQNIIHWSSIYDNDYIFNIYPNAMWNTNLWGDSVLADNLCIFWCNNDLMYKKDFNYINRDGTFAKNNDLIELIYKNTELNNYSLFKQTPFFTNNIFYNINKDNPNSINIYINIVNNLLDNRISEEVFDNYNIVKIHQNANTNDENIVDLLGYIVKRYDNYFNLIIDSKFLDKFAFKNFKNPNTGTCTYLNNQFLNYSFSNTIKDGNIITGLMNDVVESKIISIDNSISKSAADSPYDYKVKEIMYNKTNIPRHYIFRTDGCIKPTFVNYNENHYYMIKKISTNEYYKDWDSLIRTKFPAKYPSINYFYIETITDNSYRFEKKWNNNNNIYILDREINISITKQDNTPVREYIKEFLKTYYHIEYDAELLSYIYDLYEIYITFDYANKYDINNYIYQIKLTLK